MSENKNATVPVGRAKLSTGAQVQREAVTLPLFDAGLTVFSLVSRQARDWDDLLGEHRDEFRTALHVERLEKLGELIADGMRAASELLGNLGIALAFTEQLEHFALCRWNALERNDSRRF